MVTCLIQSIVYHLCTFFFFFFSSRRRHTRFDCDWSSDVCSSDLERQRLAVLVQKHVGLRAGRRALAAIDGAHLARVPVVVQQERTAGDPGALRLDESEHRLHGNGGIDRVAPLAQNLESGVDRKSVVEGKRVDLGGRRILKKKKTK